MSSNSDGPFLFLIDDSDPRLQYTGEWFTRGGAEELHNTTHGTSVPGSRVTFSFNGTFVSVFVTLDHNGVGCAYSLDGKDLIMASQPGLSTTSFRFPLFTVQNLGDQEHNLTIISQVGPGQTLWLDYLAFTGHSLPPVPSSSPMILSSTSGASHHAISTGVIVAIVLAALFGIALLAFAVIFGSRRWHRLRIARPQHDLSTSKKNTFEIMPSGADLDEQRPPRVVDALAVKFAAARNGSRSAPSHGTTLPSSVFSSVIFNTAYSGSSGSRGPSSV